MEGEGVVVADHLLAQPVADLAAEIHVFQAIHIGLAEAPDGQIVLAEK